jgi:heme exporter protein C
LFLTLHFMAIRNEILRRRLARLSLQALREGVSDADDESSSSLEAAQ